MTTFVEVWAEWDFGQEGCVFSDEEKAKTYLDNAVKAQYDPPESWKEHMGFDDYEGSSPFEAFEDAGLAGLNVVPLDPEN